MLRKTCPTCGRVFTVTLDNTSGYVGISWKSDRSKWKAYLTVDGKQKHLGYFADLEIARDAQVTAAKEAFGAFHNSSS